MSFSLKLGGMALKTGATLQLAWTILVCLIYLAILVEMFEDVYLSCELESSFIVILKKPTLMPIWGQTCLVHLGRSSKAWD